MVAEWTPTKLGAVPVVVRAKASANADGSAAAKYCAADSKGVVGLENAEFWGDVVKAGTKPGGGTLHEASTAAACCEACASTRGCNGAACVHVAEARVAPRQSPATRFSF